ncbi:mechanosensitive ion channel family protein [Sporichthya sp.]|uniref:mechanosensitive ion channel family protein n=1 Tax=Sporichthya sp. TaxID=65475 RepID=UPI0017CE2FD6|nr:mechanosensitive ion channel family protein [Sporichthya sp.]MBA3743307.1 mechanosensitive ion channel family protein [Sporichthya sp.]
MIDLLPLADPAPAPAVVTDAACYVGDESKGTLCRWVYDTFGKNETLAESSDWLIAKPAKILAILLVAWLIRKLVHRAIGRMAKRLENGVPQPAFVRGRGSNAGGSHEGAALGTAGVSSSGTLATERRRQRAQTVSSVLESVATGVIFTVAILMALSELGMNIAPLIASAGIIGVAIGFGAQSLVKDFLSGIFMVIEDQYGVGDVCDLGDAVGTVESVGLRVTRLRDVNGTVWYVRNGEILRVGNKSQGWARAVVDLDIGFDEDVDQIRQLLLSSSNALFAKPEYASMILEPPEVWGVEALSSDGLVIRLVVKTAPLQQWKVARLLRENIKRAFDQASVDFPQRTMLVRTEDDESDAGSDTDVIPEALPEATRDTYRPPDPPSAERRGLR